jgi:thiol-disulfide isomerase/thioredoxin
MFSKKYQIFVAVVMFLSGVLMALLIAQGGPTSPPSGTQVEGKPVPTQGEGLAATLPARLPSPAAFEGPNGKDVSLDDFRDKWVLVNFWATWCGPCVREMPAFQRMLDKMGKDAPAFVAISIDAMGRAASEPFATQQGWTHVKAYADPKSDLYRTFTSPGIPLTILLNPEGKEVARRLGPAQWDGELVTGQIRKLMAGEQL